MKETFLFTDISVEIMLDMFFFKLSNANIEFAEKKHIWKSYTTAAALPTSKEVELINKKKFAKKEMNKDFEMFVIYIAALKALLAGMTIYTSKITQITNSNLVQIAT